MTRNTWLHHFYDALGVPHTTRNARVGIAWMQTEGSIANFNPLNTTQWMPGCWVLPGNTAGVKEYVSFSSGMEATLDTILVPRYGYPLILQRLRASAKPRQTLDAIESSAWGTGGLIYRVYRDVKDHYWNLAAKPIPS